MKRFMQGAAAVLLTTAVALADGAIVVTSDAYRNMADLGRVKFSAAFSPADVRTEKRRLSADFTWIDAFGERRRTPASALTAEAATFDLPLYELALGESDVVCELFADGQPLGIGTNRFTRFELLPTRPVAIDRFRRCLVNGKPFFPLGALKELPPPFNCVRRENRLERTDISGLLAWFSDDGRPVADAEHPTVCARDLVDWMLPLEEKRPCGFPALRERLWRHLAQGARGLVVRGDETAEPADLIRVAAEVASMTNVILSVEGVPKVAADFEAAACRAWVRHGDLYVLVTNPLREPLAFGVTVSEGDWEVESTPVGVAPASSTDRTLSFSLPPLGVSFVKLVKRQDDPGETATWQAAIDAAAAQGGGRVAVPAGRHRVGQLYLRSNVELHLEKGAVLEGVFGWAHYPSLTLPCSEGVWRAVVFANGVTNVAITGTGEIFGDGSRWPGAPANYKGCQEGYRARGLFFNACRGVRLEDFTFRDAASWGIVFKKCDGVLARRVRIDNHGNRNNDGFDVEAKNVLIEDCDIDSGDDAVCIKSNDPSFTVENVTVRRCTARTQCNCYKIGTASHGVIRNVRFEHCRIEPPRRDSVIARGAYAGKYGSFWKDGSVECPFGMASGGLSVECVDGGLVENISFSDIEIAGGVSSPIFVRGGTRTGRKCGTPANTYHILRNILFENVRGTASGVRASSITGVDGCRVQNVLLRDVRLTCPGAGAEASARARRTADKVPYHPDLYPDANSSFDAHILPAYGLYIDRADDVTLENVEFSLATGAADVRPAIYRTEMENKKKGNTK